MQALKFSPILCFLRVLIYIQKVIEFLLKYESIFFISSFLLDDNSEDILLLTNSFDSSGLCPSWAINSLKSTPFLSKYLLIQSETFFSPF